MEKLFPFIAARFIRFSRVHFPRQKKESTWKFHETVSVSSTKLSLVDDKIEVTPETIKEKSPDWITYKLSPTQIIFQARINIFNASHLENEKLSVLRLIWALGLLHVSGLSWDWMK